MSKSKLNSAQIRQGDVLCEVIPESDMNSFKAIEPKDGRTVLAWGEVTGHSHRFEFQAGADGGSAAIAYAHPLAPGEPARVHLLAPIALKHEEHRALLIPAGTVRISRPYEYQGTELPRQVAD